MRNPSIRSRRTRRPSRRQNPSRKNARPARKPADQPHRCAEFCPLRRLAAERQFFARTAKTHRLRAMPLAPIVSFILTIQGAQPTHPRRAVRHPAPDAEPGRGPAKPRRKAALPAAPAAPGAAAKPRPESDPVGRRHRGRPPRRTRPAALAPPDAPNRAAPSRAAQSRAAQSRADQSPAARKPCPGARTPNGEPSPPAPGVADKQNPPRPLRLRPALPAVAPAPARSTPALGHALIVPLWEQMTPAVRHATAAGDPFGCLPARSGFSTLRPP